LPHARLPPIRAAVRLVSGRASALPLLALAAVVAAGHLSLLPRVADLDGFYHIGHARLYAETSVFDTALPWATQSVIGDRGGDLWWGFHVVLMPLAAAFGVEVGLRASALLLTAMLAATVVWILRRHGVEGAGWWAALFLLSVPNVFFRHLMLRPHVLSLAGSLALVSVLVRGRAWHVALLSAAVSWLHLSLFWLAPVVAAAYGLCRIPVTAFLGRDVPDRGVPIRLAVPAALAGSAAGWALRPDAPATASLLYVQLVQLFALKATDAPLTFAAELAPLSPLELLRTSGAFLPAWLTCAVLLIGRGVTALRREPRADDPPSLGPERATLAVACLAISSVFLVLTLTSARRAMEQWVSFGFLLFPLLAPDAVRRMRAPRARLVRAGLTIVVGAHLTWGAWRHTLNVEHVAFPADGLREAAAFLERSSRPGDIVFHARWDNFGPLFARNRTNRYLGGMDPIFQFAHDPASYWEFFYLSADATTEWTCDAFPCRAGVATDTHTALKDHFGARWVLVEPRRNPRLSLYLLNDARFALAHETRHEAVFEILPEPDRSPAGTRP